MIRKTLKQTSIPIYFFYSNCIKIIRLILSAFFFSLACIHSNRLQAQQPLLIDSRKGGQEVYNLLISACQVQFPSQPFVLVLLVSKWHVNGSSVRISLNQSTWTTVSATTLPVGYVQHWKFAWTEKNSFFMNHVKISSSTRAGC